MNSGRPIDESGRTRNTFAEIERDGSEGLRQAERDRPFDRDSYAITEESVPMSGTF